MKRGRTVEQGVKKSPMWVDHDAIWNLNYVVTEGHVWVHGLPKQVFAALKVQANVSGLGCQQGHVGVRGLGKTGPIPHWASWGNWPCILPRKHNKAGPG